MMRTFMSFLQRTIALLLLIALGAWLFYVGREHQIFLDNKSIERDGKNFRALEQVNVSVNGGNPIELLARDRDVAASVGPVFTVRVEVFDFMGGDVERVIERVVELDPDPRKGLYSAFTKDLMLNIPLLAAGRDDFILPPPGAALPAPGGEPPANP